MMKRSFKLVKDLETNFELASQNHGVSEKATDIKWSACLICQEDLKDKLVCPQNSNHKVEHKKRYSNNVNYIRQFENVESISVPLRNLKIENLEEECVSNKVVYHKRCRIEYNDQHYQRAIKRAKTDSNIENEPSSSRKTQSSFDAKNFQSICFLCNESTAEQLYLVISLEMDKKVTKNAAELLDERLIAKLTEGDFVATESKYHKSCLAEFYNKVTTFASKASTAEQEKSIAEGIVVAEIERYVREIIEVESDNIPVFYLQELKKLYVQQMKYYGHAVEHEHCT